MGRDLWKVSFKITWSYFLKNTGGGWGESGEWPQARLIPLKLIFYAGKTASLPQHWHTHHYNTSQQCCWSQVTTTHMHREASDKDRGAELSSQQTLFQWYSLKFGTQHQGCFGPYTLRGKTAHSTLAKSPMGSSISRRRCKWWVNGSVETGSPFDIITDVKIFSVNSQIRWCLYNGNVLLKKYHDMNSNVPLPFSN